MNENASVTAKKRLPHSRFPPPIIDGRPFDPEEVIGQLSPFVTDNKKQQIERVVSQRSYDITVALEQAAAKVLEDTFSGCVAASQLPVKADVAFGITKDLEVSFVAFAFAFAVQVADQRLFASLPCRALAQLYPSGLCHLRALRSVI